MTFLDIKNDPFLFGGRLSFVTLIDRSALYPPSLELMVMGKECMSMGKVQAMLNGNLFENRMLIQI